MAVLEKAHVRHSQQMFIENRDLDRSCELTIYKQLSHGFLAYNLLRVSFPEINTIINEIG